MKPLLRMLKYLNHYKLMIFFAVSCSLIYAAMNGFSAYLIGPFVKTLFQSGTIKKTAPRIVENQGFLDHIKYSLESKTDYLLGSGEPRDVLARLCIVIIAVIFIKNIFSYFQGYIMAAVEQGIISDLREDIYKSYHRLPLRYFQKRKTGDLISRVVNDCATINTNLNTSLIDLMKEPINIFFLLGLMIVMSWELTVFTLVAAPPCLYVISLISKRLRKRTVQSQKKISAVTSVLDETISSIRVVKAFAMEKFEVDRFKKSNRDYYRSLLKLFRMRRLAPPVTEFLGVSMAVLVLWFGGIMVFQNRGLQPDDFLKFIVLMFLLMQSAKRLSEINVKLQVGIAASSRVFEVIDQKSDIEDPVNPVTLSLPVKEIKLTGVHYEYDPGIPVLKGLTFTVKHGEKIAIVGPSGAGKSTLCDLLPRFFDPVSGSIEINGNDIRNYRLNELRGLFGIVTQETILFHDTIKANIAYGRPDISIEDIRKAASIANADEFINGFKEGYETVIGDRGTKLSGGQKQRLVIARAVLKNPPILIFDEATSSLDSESEAEVQAAMEKLLEGRTSFVIAHRLSTIQSSDRILVIDNGVIAESGTHDELYRLNGIYRRLHDLQFAQAKG